MNGRDRRTSLKERLVRGKSITSKRLSRLVRETLVSHYLEKNQAFREVLPIYEEIQFLEK